MRSKQGLGTREEKLWTALDAWEKEHGIGIVEHSDKRPKPCGDVRNCWACEQLADPLQEQYTILAGELFDEVRWLEGTCTTVVAWKLEDRRRREQERMRRYPDRFFSSTESMVAAAQLAVILSITTALVSWWAGRYCWEWLLIVGVLSAIGHHSYARLFTLSGRVGPFHFLGMKEEKR
jgi:hypothetical protein